jgi:hypothetical protein
LFGGATGQAIFTNQWGKVFCLAPVTLHALSLIG